MGKAESLEQSSILNLNILLLSVAKQIAELFSADAIVAG